MEVNQPQGNINTDLKLIKSIGYNKEPRSWARPANILKLSAVLKLKNRVTDPLHSQHLEQGREWLVKKGISLEPLLSRLSFNQQQPKQQQEHVPSDNYFHVVLSQKTLPEYLEKAQQYSTMTIMQNIMNSGSYRKKFTAKFLEQQLSQGPNKFPIWECQSQKDRRNLYLTLVKSVVEKKLQGKNVAGELLKEFRSVSGQLGQENFWDMLSFQLQAYNPHVPQHVNMTRMFVTSLKLIQQDFQKRLHGQDFQRYLSKNYISRAEGRWPFEHGGFWAKVWLYYCLGQERDVNNLLSSAARDYRDLGRLYNASEQALKSGKPIKQKYFSRYELQDVFYEQFIFNVTGQSRYSCQIMTEPKSLQLVLIVIRTLGIFYQSQKEKFQQVKQGLLRYYRDYASDPQIMRNMLYLLSYDEIVRMGPNSFMSSQDYLHFLIVMSSYSSVADQTLLQPILTQKIVQFIILLLSQSKYEYIYYIPLIPSHNIINQVSSIVLSSNTIDTFNWKGLKQLLNQEQYTNLVYTTVEKFRIREKGDLKAAKKIRELAEDQEKGFEYLVHLITSHYLNLCKYPKEEVQEAEQLGLTWSKEPETPKVYQHLFNFFHSLRVILALLVKRNEETLKSYVSNCQYIAIDLDSPNSMMLRMLQLMGDLNALNVYFYFLRLVVKAMQIYASRAREGERLEVMKRLLREQVQAIQRIADLKWQANSSQLTALRQEISIQIL